MIFYLFGFGVLFHPDHHLLGTVFAPELHLEKARFKYLIFFTRKGSKVHMTIVEYLVGFGHELSIIIVTKSSVLRVTKSPHLVKRY